MFGIGRVFVFGAFGLLFHWMQFAISKEHWLLFVFMIMGEGEVPLCVIEAENKQRNRSNHVLLVRDLCELGCLLRPFSSE